MHNINVLTLGSENFNISLQELKEHLNFRLTIAKSNLETKKFADYDILFVHEDYSKSKDTIISEALKKSDKVKILATYQNKKDLPDFFTDKLSLPIHLKDLNQIIENSITKKNFSKNSSIKIKSYILDKNEKKLTRDKDFILLTEKEIQLLELFLMSSKPLSKDNILEKVWKYSKDADTHTVETHIYRLRKKIKSKFVDDSFILNNKKGYVL